MISRLMHWLYCEWKLQGLPFRDHREWARCEALRVDVGRFWPKRRGRRHASRA